MNFSTSTGQQGISRPKDTPAVPDTLIWDLWLGPAPERPYNLPTSHSSGVAVILAQGALGDIGCHSFDPFSARSNWDLH